MEKLKPARVVIKNSSELGGLHFSARIHSLYKLLRAKNKQNIPEGDWLRALVIIHVFYGDCNIRIE